MQAATVFDSAANDAPETGTRRRFFPAMPHTIEELGISQNTLVDLFLKMTLIEGETSITSLSKAMHVEPGIVNQVFSYLRGQQYVEVKGMIGNNYVLTLTGGGRKLAQDRYQMNQYVGPAPVPLDVYNAAIKQQSFRQRLNRERLHEIFHDLVLPEETIDQLGPAILSNSQIFLYGSTGNGKTSVAERLVRIFDDDIFVPHAIEVQGQIINIADSVVHTELEAPGNADKRWLRCTRPCIAVGGEMVPEMLELRYEETLGYYTAPLQMKANNGLFIIDDFGRQMINPRDLLNRWIVPLDRGIDFLSLRTGVKLSVPFETMVIFSTNLDPRQLADEAFLRRIQNKVKIETVSDEIFDRILQAVCKSAGLEWTLEGSAYVREACKIDGRKAVLRACYPRDVVRILKNIADYEDREPGLIPEDIDRAIGLYFAR